MELEKGLGRETAAFRDKVQLSGCSQPLYSETPATEPECPTFHHCRPRLRKYLSCFGTGCEHGRCLPLLIGEEAEIAVAAVGMEFAYAYFRLGTFFPFEYAEQLLDLGFQGDDVDLMQSPPEPGAEHAQVGHRGELEHHQSCASEQGWQQSGDVGTAVFQQEDLLPGFVAPCRVGIDQAARRNCAGGRDFFVENPDIFRPELAEVCRTDALEPGIALVGKDFIGKLCEGPAVHSHPAGEVAYPYGHLKALLPYQAGGEGGLVSGAELGGTLLQTYGLRQFQRVQSFVFQ